MSILKHATVRPEPILRARFSTPVQIECEALSLDEPKATYDSQRKYLLELKLSLNFWATDADYVNVKKMAERTVLRTLHESTLTRLDNISYLLCQADTISPEVNTALAELAALREELVE